MSNILKFTSVAPSNIAFIKYWGKIPDQVPMNSSLSMTLNHCVTKMKFVVDLSRNNGFEQFIFEGVEREDFKKKMSLYLEKHKEAFSFVDEISFQIESENTFPHSSGIASSASSMASFVQGLFHIKKVLGQKNTDKNTLSHFSRLASGSACRSFDSGFSIWGEESLKYSVKFDDIHDELRFLNDTIIVVDKNEKHVSSSVGHSLMNEHPFRQQRVVNANRRMVKLKEHMAQGDFNQFGEIIEAEALELHALMMTSKTPYLLLRPRP